MNSRSHIFFVLCIATASALAQPVQSFAQTAAITAARTSPLGYRETHTLPGVSVWRKGREYVQVVTPAKGGRIKLLTGEIKPSMMAGTSFARKDIRDWWTIWQNNDPRAVSVANGQFFNMNDPLKAPLAFSTKVDGIIHPGYGDGVEYPQGKLILLLGEHHYDVASYDDNAAALFAHAEREALVGLKPDMSKRATKRAGRTFIGVTPEGNAIILTSPGATQRYATRILIAFGAQRGKILMLDGGGSSQLVTKDGLLVPSRQGGGLRTVPQAIGVAAGM